MNLRTTGTSMAPSKLRSRRGAFTLVELLVIIGIIGILVSILVPALASVRESARRTTCQNNLRQIGIALQSHHESKETFPAGGIEWRPPGNTTNRQLAWSAFLLPFLDANSIFETLDLSTPFDSEENSLGAAAILPVYLCPTSIRGAALVDGRGPCDYGGIFGERISSPNDPPKGTMIYDKRYGATDIPDGLSTTLIVAEDTAWSDGQWINGRNVFDQAFAINAAPKFENDIRSYHPGGANAVTASGHVRFLDESIDLSILAALCTRAGREIVPRF